MNKIEIAKHLFHEGIALAQQNDIEQAEVVFQQALALVPERVSVMTNLAAVQLKLGKFQDADNLISRAIELDPNTSMHYFNRGVCLSALLRKNEALQSFASAIDLNPRFLEAYNAKSMVLRELGRVDEAVALGEKILVENYASFFGREINLNCPETFTEKLFCRLIHMHRSRSDIYSRYTDKYLVRNYVEKTIGDAYLPNLIWSGVDACAIPYSDLPDICFLKSNTGSSMNMVLNRPFDLNKVGLIAGRWRADDYYWRGREYQYLDISDRLLIEEYLNDGHQDGPLDYRFYCFHGHPVIIQVDNNQHMINTFYDTGWNKLNLSYRNQFEEFDLNKPENFDEMLAVVSALCSPFDFVRVDLYNCFGRILFGELTFTPVAGYIRFNPNSWDAYLGAKWNYVAP